MDLRVCVLVFAIFCSYQTRKSLMVDNISVTHGREIHRGGELQATLTMMCADIHQYNIKMC